MALRYVGLRIISYKPSHFISTLAASRFHAIRCVVRRQCVNRPFYVRFGINSTLSSSDHCQAKMSRTLYMNDLSPPARAVKMTIHLLGLKVDTSELNPVLREQDTPEFVKLNPMRTIPIYVEGDFSLADSHAIMIYLLETYGKDEHSYLYPKDKRKRATINQRLFFDCGVLFTRLRSVMAPSYMGRLTELTVFMKQNLDDAYTMLEEYLTQNVFLADDHWTIADLSAYTTTQSLNAVHPVDEKRFPKVKKWFSTMSELDIIRQVNEPGGEAHGKSILMCMEANKKKKSNL